MEEEEWTFKPEGKWQMTDDQRCDARKLLIISLEKKRKEKITS